MSYRRRRKRKYPYKYTRRYRRWSRGLSMANKALKVAYGVKKLVNVEWKFHDDTDTHSFVTYGLVCLNEIARGDTCETRDGCQMRMKSIKLLLNIEGEAQQTKSTLVAIDLVLDTVSDGTDPSVATTGTGIFEATSATAMRNLEAGPRSRYIILKSWKCTVGQLGQPNSNKTFKYFRKLNHKCTYFAETADPPRKNGLWLVMRVYNPEGTYNPLLTYRSRIRYIDN